LFVFARICPEQLTFKQDSDENSMEIEEVSNMDVVQDQEKKKKCGDENVSGVPSVVDTVSVSSDPQKIDLNCAQTDSFSLTPKLANDCITVPACIEKQTAEVRFTPNIK